MGDHDQCNTCGKPHRHCGCKRPIMPMPARGKFIMQQEVSPNCIWTEPPNDTSDPNLPEMPTFCLPTVSAPFSVPAIGEQGQFQSEGAHCWACPGFLMELVGLGIVEIVSVAGDVVTFTNIDIDPTAGQINSGTKIGFPNNSFVMEEGDPDLYDDCLRLVDPETGLFCEQLYTVYVRVSKNCEGRPWQQLVYMPAPDSLEKVLCDDERRVCHYTDRVPMILRDEDREPILDENGQKQVVMGRYKDSESFSGSGNSWVAGTHNIEQGNNPDGTPKVLDVHCYSKEITCPRKLQFRSRIQQAMPCFLSDPSNPATSDIVDTTDIRDPESKFAIWFCVTQPDNTVVNSPAIIFDGGQPLVNNLEYLGEATQAGIYNICIKGRGMGGNSSFSVVSATILSDD